MLTKSAGSLALLCLTGLASAAPGYHCSPAPISALTALRSASSAVMAVSSNTSVVETTLSTNPSIPEGIDQPALARRDGVIIPSFFRVCTGPPNYVSEPMCTGTCGDHWIQCNTSGIPMPPEQIQSRVQFDPIDCIATNTTIPFDVCDWKRRSCNSFEVFNPRMDSHGLRIFNTPLTHWVDINCHKGPHPSLAPA